MSEGKISHYQRMSKILSRTIWKVFIRCSAGGTGYGAPMTY